MAHRFSREPEQGLMSSPCSRFSLGIAPPVGASGVCPKRNLLKQSGCGRAGLMGGPLQRVCAIKRRTPDYLSLMSRLYMTRRVTTISTFHLRRPSAAYSTPSQSFLKNTSSHKNTARYFNLPVWTQQHQPTQKVPRRCKCHNFVQFILAEGRALKAQLFPPKPECLSVCLKPPPHRLHMPLIFNFTTRAPWETHP